MKAAQTERILMQHRLQHWHQVPFRDRLRGADHFLLGDRVHRVDVVHAGPSIRIALVHRVHLHPAGLPARARRSPPAGPASDAPARAASDSSPSSADCRCEKPKSVPDARTLHVRTPRCSRCRIRRTAGPARSSWALSTAASSAMSAAVWRRVNRRRDARSIHSPRPISLVTCVRLSPLILARYRRTIPFCPLLSRR